MAERIWIISTTVDREAAARELGRGAVEARLAACAQIEASITSHYHWEGILHESGEWRILYKTSEPRKEALAGWILANHPYEVPEILVWPADSANPAYTEWVGKM